MKIYKLLTLILITSFISSSKSVDASTSIYKSGVYAGFSVGYSKMRGENKSSIFIPGVIQPTIFTQDSKVNHALGGDVFLGGRYLSPKGFLTGLDFAIAWDGNTLKYTSFANRSKVETNLKTPYKLIPGVTIGHTFLNKFLAFVKLGASITQFRGGQNISSINIGNFNKRKVGFYSSLNLEYALNEQVSAITSASYEYYGKINKNYPNFVPLPGSQSTISIKPSYLTAKIGLVFRFS